MKIQFLAQNNPGKNGKDTALLYLPLLQKIIKPKFKLLSHLSVFFKSIKLFVVGLAILKADIQK